MSNVYNKAHELVSAVKKSEEYKNYKKLRDSIYKDENNKKMLEDFRERAIQVQMAELTGEEVSEEDLDKLKKLEEIIMLNPSLKDFMFAEMKFSQLINDVNKIISDGIDLD